MYERWNATSDPKRVLKAMVLMAPCFFGDQDMYDFYEVSGVDLRRKAITDLAEIFALELWEDTIADLLSQEGEEGVFTQKYYRSATEVLQNHYVPRTNDSDSTDTPASSDPKEPSVDVLMDGQTLDYGLTSQRASILASLPWWEAISRMLKADTKAMLKRTSDEADRCRET